MHIAIRKSLFRRSLQKARHILGTKFLRLAGARETHWARVVMDLTTAKFVGNLPVNRYSALEISGTKWRSFGFASYNNAEYPDFDICSPPHSVSEYDVVLVEQVLEHVQWPRRAVESIYSLLKPGGYAVITTPFLLKIHNFPIDCSRWTPLGLKCLLADGGFPMDAIVADGWGNRACIRSNYTGWTPYIPWLHSLKNEPEFPIVCWAFARKPTTDSNT